MCGIGGIVALSASTSPPTEVELRRMTRALHHRGPDAQGVLVAGKGGLAHTRLSIIDLSGGRQPMENEAGTISLSYNGEVFNYVELREQLIALGRRFRTQSDTEVVLAAYEAWGEDAFARFNGQFAIAIWDAQDEKLVLARDRIGVRPIYLCHHAGRVYFASEVKAIFAADPTITRALDPIGIDETLTFWTVVPPRSVFAGIEELRPGFVRVYRRGDRKERAYWSLSYPTSRSDLFQGTLEEAVEAVRDALQHATKLRMLRADVPVGSYLSGGLDSSLVSALARRATTARFNTFSLRFEDAEYDETSYQRLAAAELGTDHHEIVVRRSDIAEVFPEVILHTERPILRTAPAPLFLLSRLVSRDVGIKVVLTGEGADEMFAGYDLFREGKVRRFWAKDPGSTLRPLLLARLYPYLARSPVTQVAMAQRFFGHGLDNPDRPGFAHDMRWHTTSALKRLLSAETRAAIGAHDATAALLATLPDDFSRFSPLSQDQYIEVRTLLSGYLLSSQGDRMLMAHSVEGRFPFLDADVVELANRLPPSYKLRVLDEKHVLRRAGRGLVPEAILARKKTPYRAPDALCFVGPWAPSWVGEALRPEAVARAGIFDPQAVTVLHEKCQRHAGDAQLSNTDNMALVGVLSTQLLYRMFIETNEAVP
ncbi:MAG: asparagine synthase (glutamine-hydrolyzing) [Byssovorax sp.]